MKQFASGAKSSEEAPRYDLIEPAFLDAVARRMAQGAASHGERNYLAGVGDQEFVRDRLNHLVGHVLKLAAGDTSDDHLAAACANLNMLAVLLPDREQSAPFVANEPPAIPNGNMTYDERRANLAPCKCGAIFTHPERCAASEKCLAEQHPHFRRPLTLAEQRSRTP